MIPVDKVDVGMAWRPKQHGIASSFSDGCVRGGIVSAEVSFNFDNAGCHFFLAHPPDENFSQQPRPNYSWVAIVEGAGKNLQRRHKKIIAQEPPAY